jgi:hypothetical protein
MPRRREELLQDLRVHPHVIGHHLDGATLVVLVVRGYLRKRRTAPRAALDS